LPARRIRRKTDCPAHSRLRRPHTAKAKAIHSLRKISGRLKTSRRRAGKSWPLFSPGKLALETLASKRYPADLAY